MVSYRLRLFFFLAALLFIAHGTEEYLADFHHIDPIFRFVFAPLLIGDSFQASFVTFQIMIWIFLLLSFLLLQGKKYVLGLLCIPGVVMILETHHLFEALIARSYSPGALTALLFPFLAFFYWKELLREFKSSRAANGM